MAGAMGAHLIAGLGELLADVELVRVMREHDRAECKHACECRSKANPSKTVPQAEWLEYGHSALRTACKARQMLHLIRDLPVRAERGTAYSA